MDRRTFLAASASLFPGLRHLSFALEAQAARETTTLITVFLRGGADTLNLVVPYADDGYYRQRPTVAIPAPGSGKAGAALALTEHYGLHPAMAALQPAFLEGRMGVLQGVGVNNTSGSHFECQDQMEQGAGTLEEAVSGGWMGRFLRQQPGTTGSLSAIAVGKALPEALRGAPSVSVMESLADIAIQAPAEQADQMVRALDALYATDRSAIGEQGRVTLDLFRRVEALQKTDDGPANGASYPKDPFGNGLREIARLIRARVGLQVAAIDLGGWDTHFVQGGAEGLQAQKARLLAEGLAALETDLKAERGRYTVLVFTEFGRRMYENASLGTDHGRAFACLALGEKVHGGKVQGPWPLSALDESSPIGPGGLEVTTDYRRVFADALRTTFGTQEAVMKGVFEGGLEPSGLFL